MTQAILGWLRKRKDDSRDLKLYPDNFLIALWKTSMFSIDLKLTLSFMDTSTHNPCPVTFLYRRSSCAVLTILLIDSK